MEPTREEENVTQPSGVAHCSGTARKVKGPSTEGGDTGGESESDGMVEVREALQAALFFIVSDLSAGGLQQGPDSPLPTHLRKALALLGGEQPEPETKDKRMLPLLKPALGKLQTVSQMLEGQNLKNETKILRTLWDAMEWVEDAISNEPEPNNTNHGDSALTHQPSSLVKELQERLKSGQQAHSNDLVHLDNLARAQAPLLELYQELNGCVWRREDGGENRIAVCMANIKSALSPEPAAPSGAPEDLEEVANSLERTRDVPELFLDHTKAAAQIRAHRCSPLVSEGDLELINFSAQILEDHGGDETGPQLCALASRLAASREEVTK
jgi:hypothetical protein